MSGQSMPHRSTGRGPVLFGVLLCACLAASIWTEWTLLGSRLSRLEAQTRHLEEIDAQREQRQRGRGGVETLVKSSVKTVEDALDAHRQEQEKLFRTWEERMGAAEHRMDNFLQTLRDLKSTAQQSNKPGTSSETVTRQQQQLDELSKALETATQSWLSKAEDLQATMQQQDKKLLRIDTVAKITGDQGNEISKLRKEIMAEHEALTSLLTHHQTQVADVAEKQQALEIRMSESDMDSPVSEQTAVNSGQAGAKPVTAVSTGGSPVETGLATNTDGYGKASMLDDSNDADEEKEQQDDLDAVQGGLDSQDEDLQGEDSLASSPPDKVVTKDIPTATSSVAGIPDAAAEAASKGTPSATSSVVADGKTAATTIGKPSLPSPSREGFGGAEDEMEASSVAGGADDSHAGPEATSSVAGASIPKAAGQQATADGTPVFKAKAAGVPDAKVDATGAPGKQGRRGGHLGLGGGKQHGAAQDVQAGVGLDDTDLEAQVQLAALTGNEAEAGSSATIVSAPPKADATLANLDVDDGPTAASSVVGEPASVTAQNAKQQPRAAIKAGGNDAHDAGSVGMAGNRRAGAAGGAVRRKVAAGKSSAQ